MPVHRHHPWKPCVGGLIALSLGACTGLPQGERIPSIAMKDNHRTRLAAAIQPRVAAHPDKSGLHALADGKDALAARLVLADVAQRSLDVQYFIWKQDQTSKVLMERLFRAADRGVRIRMLLDDLGTMPSDEVLLAIDSHPKIEVRMFNPVALRSPRVLGIVADFRRVNRRMHNKSFIADGQVAIVGGRNIGDEYFDAHETANFADLDVAVIGPVVKETSEAFDLYWNHRASIPMAVLSRKHMTPEKLAARRAEFAVIDAEVKDSAYGKRARDGEFARQFRSRSVDYSWGRASILSDHPDKVLGTATDTHMSPKLREAVGATKRELFLVSPYFVPGEEGVAFLSRVRQRGVRVVVITNSLASTDGVPVHAGYQRYRKPLLEAGVELYEMKPTANAPRKSRSGSLRGSAAGSSSASLHAKTFTFDRRTGFIGSYNLDPRSSKLNTEMGVMFDLPELVAQIPEALERNLERNAYRLELEHNRLVWVTREGDQQKRYTTEPEAGLWKRTKVRILSWLPIEGLL
jgi:putative cardiolipin synthase